MISMTPEELAAIDAAKIERSRAHLAAHYARRASELRTSAATVIQSASVDRIVKARLDAVAALRRGIAAPATPTRRAIERDCLWAQSDAVNVSTRLRLTEQRAAAFA